METKDQRPSDNFEDRGRGRGGGGRGRGGMGSAMGARVLFSVFRLLGVKGTLIAAIPVGLVLLVNPFGIRTVALGLLTGEVAGPSGAAGSVCEAQPEACDFSARILGATEEVWAAQFQQGRLPGYGVTVTAYQEPTLVVFTNSVSTACGVAPSSVGPFYCPGDSKLYLDPGFYEVMAGRLKAPGDFAQAYVIAHEVGHHVQNLIGSSRVAIKGEDKNQTSVRVELQADCLSGVWGHQKQGDLKIDEADLAEALGAAHAIGDDALGHKDARTFTHGSSAQRVKWFRRGFDSGDARTCDTFAVEDFSQL